MDTNPPDRSTGRLYPNDNPAYNAPGMIGKITIHRELLELWWDQIDDKDTVIASGAIWAYARDGKKYVSFEISPHYSPKAKNRHPSARRQESSRLPVDALFADVPGTSDEHQSEG